MSTEQAAITENDITEFLSNTIGKGKAVVGVSGGIDSSLVLMLLSRTLDKQSIIAVFMPDAGTPERDYEDIRKLSEASGINVTTINIQPVVDAFTKTLSASDTKAIGNIKSRVRMVTLYYHANLNSGFVVGTTNRSENLIGYFTKYGDGGCDLEPIIGLYKSQVREMSRRLNVPTSIIDKKPSAGLWADQTDEEEMGMSYDELDRILTDLFDRNSGEVSRKHSKVMQMYNDSRHKRNLPVTKEN